MNDTRRDNLIDIMAVQAMSDDALDRLLAEAGEIAVPADLSFDAAEIMRMAKAGGMQAAEEPSSRKGKVVSLFARKNIRRYASLAAAFALLIGAGSFGMNSLRMGRADDAAYSIAAMEDNGAVIEADMEAAPQETALMCDGKASEFGFVKEQASMDTAAGSSEEAANMDLCRIIIVRDEFAANLLEEALEDPDFAEEFDLVTEGRDFEILGANTVEETTEFMIYLFDGPQDGADGTGYAYNRRYITWIRK